jgi:hypothetical protein
MGKQKVSKNGKLIYKSWKSVSDLSTKKYYVTAIIITIITERCNYFFCLIRHKRFYGINGLIKKHIIELTQK